MDVFSHSELVNVAKAWLRRNGCGVVFGEIVSACMETPDAIGFRYNQSVLIEVKVSRSDFLADRNKMFREYPEMGMGNVRYYLAPKGMLTENDMPDKWTLLEYSNGRVYGEKVHLKNSGHMVQQSNIGNEKILLQSVCRRMESLYGDIGAHLKNVSRETIGDNHGE